MFLKEWRKIRDSNPHAKDVALAFETSCSSRCAIFRGGGRGTPTLRLSPRPGFKAGSSSRWAPSEEWRKGAESNRKHDGPIRLPTGDRPTAAFPSEDGRPGRNRTPDSQPGLEPSPLTTAPTCKMVGMAGVEPARPLGHRGLSPARFPFHHIPKMVTREGVEPSRPKAPASETGVATVTPPGQDGGRCRSRTGRTQCRHSGSNRGPAHAGITFLSAREPRSFG